MKQSASQTQRARCVGLLVHGDTASFQRDEKVLELHGDNYTARGMSLMTQNRTLKIVKIRNFGLCLCHIIKNEIPGLERQFSRQSG